LGAKLAAGAVTGAGVIKRETASVSLLQTVPAVEVDA